MPLPQRTPLRLICLKVEPETKASEPALHDALSDLARGDPDLSFTIDAESGETIVYGVSEPHLDVAVGMLRSRGIGVNVGAPQIAYREFLNHPAEVDYTLDKQIGGARPFARVKLRLEPNENSEGNEFASVIVGGSMPNEYILRIEEGVRSVWESGVLIGFPLIDTKVTLLEGAFHEANSSAIGFEVAARVAMKEGCEKAGVWVLEPIMDVEVVTPGDFVGGIIATLNAGRAYIRTIEMRHDNLTMIRANVPLANMFGYISLLRSRSDGRATHRMAFSHYQEVPHNITSGPDTFPPAIGMRA